MQDRGAAALEQPAVPLAAPHSQLGQWQQGSGVAKLISQLICVYSTRQLSTRRYAGQRITC